MLAASHLLLLIKRHRFIIYRVFSNDVFHQLLVSSTVYFPGFCVDDLVSFPVIGLIRSFGQSPCPIRPTRLSLQVFVDP